jgi:hypothetical protein
MFITQWKRALALGFLSWLLPFAIGFVLFPLKQINAPLFETFMALALVVVAAGLGRQYFRGVANPGAGEAAAVGMLWLGINLILDYPMFAYGPMQMTAARYYSEIGTGYLLYPAFLSAGVWAFRPQTQPA